MGASRCCKKKLHPSAAARQSKVSHCGGEVVWSWGAIAVLWVSHACANGVVSPMNNYRKGESCGYAARAPA